MRTATGLLLCSTTLLASAAFATDHDVEVLFTAPAEVPINELVPPPSPTEVTAFRGQPRIANDGTWYALYSFPLPSNPPPIQFTRDFVMLRDGVPWIREGLQLNGSPDFAPIADQAFSQQPFFDVSVGDSGTVAQIIRVTDEFGLLPDGTPDPNDLDFPTGQIDALVLDRVIVESEGEEADVVPGIVFPENALESLSIAKLNASGSILVKGNLDTGEGPFDPDLPVIYQLDNPGTESEVKTLRFAASEDIVVPDLGFSISSLSSNEEDVKFNDDGSVLLTVDVRGAPGTEDGAAVLYNGVTDTYELLAREGQPSPVEGRPYSSVFNVPVALNDAGDWAFRASLSGDFADNGVIVVNDEIIAQEAMLVGTAVPGQVQLGFANANIEIDAEGNIIWYGAWNAPKDDYCPDNENITSPFIIFEGLFQNDELIVEGGVTEVHDVVIDGVLFPTLIVKDLPNTSFGGFTLSPDGRYLIFSALLAEPSDDICAFSINNDATPVAHALLRIDLLAAETCIGDITGPGGAPDGQVNVEDLLVLLANWGTPSDPDADLNGDGHVDVEDLLALLAAWGPCPE